MGFGLEASVVCQVLKQLLTLFLNGAMIFFSNYSLSWSHTPPRQRSRETAPLPFAHRKRSRMHAG